MPKTWTGDDLRATFAALFPRPGWKARNLDADSGRVYDFADYRDMQALVEVSYDDHYVEGYFKGERVYERSGTIDPAFAMARVEDLCAAELNQPQNRAEGTP